MENVTNKVSMDRKSLVMISFSALFAFLGFLTVVYYIYGPGVGYMHADCTDTLYWAKASYDSGRWISDNFRYAGILPFGGNLLMLLYLPIFGMTITTHNLGMLTFLILFCIGIYLATRALDMSMSWRFLTIGVILLTVSSSDKMREIFWGHVIYYSLGFLLLCFGIAVLGMLQKRYAKGNLRIWHCALAILYFALVGLDGSQMLVLVTVPLLFGLCLERFFDTTSSLNSKENRAALIQVTCLVISVFIGLLWLKIISHGVTSSYANTYSSWVSMSEWVNNLHALPIDWFRLFGLEINGRMPLFSVESFGQLIRLAAAVVVAVGPVYVLLCYPKIKNRKVQFYAIVHTGLSLFILIGYIFGMLATANWRLSPIIVSGTLLLLLFLSSEWKIQTFSARLFALAGLLVMMFAVENVAVVWKMDWNYNRDKDIYQVADFLEQEGLDYGYATFWNSQLITVYTGEKVKARNMLIDDKGHHFESYQSEYTWGDPQPGQQNYFLLFSKSEYTKWRNTPRGEELSQQTIREYQDVHGFVILVFDQPVG